MTTARKETEVRRSVKRSRVFLGEWEREYIYIEGRGDLVFYEQCYFLILSEPILQAQRIATFGLGTFYYDTSFFFFILFLKMFFIILTY
jgi:hypothetical protein